MEKRVFLIRTTKYLLVLFLISSFASCQSTSRPPLEQLMLTQIDLPGEWFMASEGPHSPTGQAPLGGGLGATEALVVFFYHLTGDGSAGTSENLYRFRNLREAKEAYQRVLQTAFHDGYDWYWAPPEFDPPDLPNASESRFQCTKDRSEEMCLLVARYHYYVLILQTDLFGTNSQLMVIRVLSYNDLQTIFDVIDEKMILVMVER